MLVLLVLSLILNCLGCTNFLITPGATVNNASMITYNTDSHTTYGYLARYPAGTHKPGTMLKIYDWETGLYLGEIPEAPVTYSVIGNMNEFQLTIGETTFGGRDFGHQQDGKIDYGSLIYIALQRSKNAREAIHTMTSLVAQYGYASEGESFSISDPTEVWVMDFIGKGKYQKGAVWVARRIPDGMVCAHANQARITTFPRDDPDNCLFSPDVVAFAKNVGIYNGTDADFSFSDIYNPLSFEGARACEARVWSFFSKITSGMDKYLNYAQGYNLTNRMPLWVQPTKPLDLKTVIKLMRDHYEGTWFDFTGDIGAGPWGLPYRWRPLDWKVGADTYINERAIATQQTGMTFVSQSRGYLPNAIGGVLWFGVDDSALTVHAPMYCGITRIPRSLERYGVADMMTFSFESAFWVFNLVSNLVYTRYNIIYPEVIVKIESMEDAYITESASIEAKVHDLIRSGHTAKATHLLTQYSVSTYDSLVASWTKYWQYLFVRFMDGNVKTATSNPEQPKVEWPGYGAKTYQQIATQTGTHYEVPSSSSPSNGPLKKTPKYL